MSTRAHVATTTSSRRRGRLDMLDNASSGPASEGKRPTAQDRYHERTRRVAIERLAHAGRAVRGGRDVVAARRAQPRSRRLLGERRASRNSRRRAAGRDLRRGRVVRLGQRAAALFTRRGLRVGRARRTRSRPLATVTRCDAGRRRSSIAASQRTLSSQASASGPRQARGRPLPHTFALGRRRVGVPQLERHGRC